MQRLHEKVSGNWQKFTTMVYEINKSRNVKKRIEITFGQKSFWIYDNDRKENNLIYAHHISYKNFFKSFALILSPTIIQNWMKN